MNQTKIDLLNFENELLQTRKKMNDLIYRFSRSPQTLENKALYQEKIFYLETELSYMTGSFRNRMPHSRYHRNCSHKRTFRASLPGSIRRYRPLSVQICRTKIMKNYSAKVSWAFLLPC